MLRKIKRLAYKAYKSYEDSQMKKAQRIADFYKKYGYAPYGF